MDKHKLIVSVGWTEDNFCCGLSEDSIGTVVATGKSLDSLKRDFKESLSLHIQGCLEDGDELPEWLAAEDFELDFVLDAAALLRDAEQYTTIAAISRASGINQRQLSHYATGVKKARAAQRQRIVDGLHKIGQSVLALG